MNNRIEIKLNEHLALVAEINPDDNYKEIFVGVEKDGRWCQDLVIVGEGYHYDGDLNTVPNDNYRVLVYGNAKQEDCTDVFTIKKYEEGS